MLDLLVNHVLLPTFNHPLQNAGIPVVGPVYGVYGLTLTRLRTHQGLKSNGDGPTVTSDGLQPNSDGLQPNSDGLQPKNNGLQPN